MPSNNSCCVPNCNVKRGDQIALHSFPNPDNEPDRFRSWIYAVKGDILALENQAIYKKRKVCHKHFEAKYHTWTKTLSPNAIPTLNLPGILQKRQPLVNITNESASSSSKKVADANMPPNQPVPNIEAIPMQQDLETNEVEPKQPTASTTERILQKRQPLVNITNKSASSSSGKVADANMPPNQPVPNIEAIPMQQDLETNEVEPKQPTASTTKRCNKKFVKADNSLMSEIRKLKKHNMSYQKRLKQAKKLSTNSAFQKALNKFNTLAAIFTLMQFREINKPKMGRRFTKKGKVMALSIYKNGPKAYRWLSKIFVLPSPVTLSRMVSRANLRSGMNSNIFEQLKKKVNKMKIDDRICTLIFDEMALSPHFEYNQKKDKITGYVNHTGEATRKIADHVLVFMIRGVMRNYKQPIYYSFCSGSTPKTILAAQIKEIIRNLHKIGFIVIATICDQGTTNTGAINYLVEERRINKLKNNEHLRTYTFEIDGKEIIPLYDVPHLLKGMRNNLLSKDLKFSINGEEKVAKWNHITQLYENNPAYKGLKIIKNLTENHCQKDKIPKMKVKFASQLLSQTVGKTMGYLAENGILPEETKHTADFILFMDDLFDSLNGSYKNSNVRSGKDLLRNVTPKSRHTEIWSQAKNVLRTMKFVTTKGSYGTVPTINNWLKTIENMELLRDKLFSEYNIKSFWCRHLNQDPLENFFGTIRSHGLRNISPSCTAFEAAFASLLVTNMSNYSRGSNCEDDFCTMFECFEELFFRENTKTNADLEIDFNDILNENIVRCFETKKENPRIIAQLEYVTGYILKKAKSKKIYPKCNICKECLYTEDPEANKYIKYREYSKNKKCLMYPSTDLTKCFSEIQDILHHVLRHKSNINNLKNYIKTILYVNVNTDFIKCNNHKSEIIEFIFDFSCKFFTYNWCKMTNKLLCGTSKDVDVLDSIQNQALLYYNKRKKVKATAVQA